MKKLTCIILGVVFCMCSAVVHAQCTLEEALDAPGLTWTTGGDLGWYCVNDGDVYYGTSCAINGMISAFQTSWLETTVTIDTPKILSFYWKVATPGDDYLNFYIDSNFQTGINDVQIWSQQTYSLSPGTHTLRWEYVTGADAGWGRVDKVEILDPPALAMLAHYADMYALPRIPTPLFAKNRVAKARPDECYDNGTVGEPDEFDICTFGTPKTNQAYVWGLARSGNLWFGTAPNVLCLVMSAMGVPPIEAPDFVCEFDEADNATNRLGDWRTPQIFEYDPATMLLTERTPQDLMDNETLGIRSAGALDGVVLLAGPSFDSQRVNVFAFSDDGAYLGMHVFDEYKNIRQWMVHEGVMYTGVSRTADGEGRILRWTGNASDPFQFETVGRLDSAAANMTVHNNRLFVTTWPSFALGGGLGGAMAGLWMSPQIPPGGLTGSDNDTWEKVWSVDDYEPDRLVARIYGCGALASHNGTLYWGTMHVPFIATMAALRAYDLGAINLGGLDDSFGPDDLIATALGTHRAVSIFSSSFENSATTVDLLYGDEYLPVYDSESRGYTIAEDDLHRNTMDNPVPRFGPSGIGNFFNAYTWTMDPGFADYPDKGGVLLGTFDWSLVARELAEVYLGGSPEFEAFALVLDQLQRLYASYGSDLYVIQGADEPFVLESKNGAGNEFNYGIRTMLIPDMAAMPAAPAAENGECQKGYLGMANPFNLADEGGWELVEIYPLPELDIVAPVFQELVQGDVVLQAQDLSACPLNNVVFHVIDIFAQVSIFPATYNEETEMWEYMLGTATMPMPNGIYTVFAVGTDFEGAGAQSAVVPFVIANDCVQDSDCDDGFWCTGTETCNETFGACVLGTSPCESGLVCDEDNDTCVECLGDGDCDDGLWCTGAETCDEMAGACIAGTSPCGSGLVCDEDNDTCVECLTDGDCALGYECVDSVCVLDCSLYIRYKKLFAAKLAKKAKKCTLKITGNENFDIYGEIDLGPLTWTKVKFNPKKNILTIKAIVPQGLPAGVYPISIGDCAGAITVL